MYIGYMLNRLTFNISFPSTGKAFSQDIKFKPGLTIIRGANETGKSLILEMIRYALFGVAALRGSRSDYDNLDVELSFSTKGNSYKVIRHGNKATLNSKLAVGTAAVNREIIKILGFDLDVFDIGCAAVQGDLDKLTKRMQPSERRRMVEEVIGLNNIEEEEKECRTEGNTRQRVAEKTLEKLVIPEPPHEPERYEPSSVLESLYHNQLRIEAERSQLLRMRKPVKPQKPIKPCFKDDVEEHEKRRLEIEREKLGIERTIRRIPPITRARQDIENAQLYYEQQKLGPRPTQSLHDCERWLNEWEILRTIGTLVSCPKCGTEFDPSTSEICHLPSEPPLSYEEVRAEILANEKWRDYTGLVIESTDITKKELENELLALAQASHRNELCDALTALPDLPDRSKEAERRRIYYNEIAVYKRLSEQYDANLSEWRSGQQRLKKLPESDPDLPQKLKNSQIFEEQMRRYDADKAAYDEAVRSVETEKELAEGFFKGAEALKEVRLKVKQHLVPSLNKVASHLLYEMTDGVRSRIVVNEDFEVEVDGQPVRTLSGSGVSVVNLALRIALGQVLTQSVVPLFLADEIDHDMDPERAKATHESLKKLTKILDKVIVVTHKNIEGDNIINL